MSQSAVRTKDSLSGIGNNPQRLAWGVILLAFAAFCVLCVSIGVGVSYFLFQSTLPMDVVLAVGRGSVGIVEPTNERFSRSQTVISPSTEISTDSQSQARVAFVGSEEDGQLIADLTLNINSSVNFRSAVRPRFNWSTSDYLIDLREAVGELDLTISRHVSRDVTVSVQPLDKPNVFINLDGPGRYTIDISRSQIAVYNRDGKAFIILEGRQGYSIPVHERGVFYAENSQVEILPGYVNLLRNSSFDTLNPSAGTGSTQELLNAWICGNDPNDNPPGSYRSQLYEGRMTLRLERYQDATTHGRTFCFQTFGSSGLNIQSLNLDQLSLRLSFFVHHQSLSICGIDGSECPLTLRMDYIDQEGESHNWFHGFYTRRDPQSPSPLRCDSCAQEHEFINEKSWYTYNSGNLLTLFPEDQKINSIIGIWFYASGHQYDVQVEEVSLLAQYASSDVAGG